jgi:hypothetical protein
MPPIRGTITQKSNGVLSIMLAAAAMNSVPEMGDEVTIDIQRLEQNGPGTPSVQRLDGQPMVTGEDGLIHGESFVPAPTAAATADAIAASGTAPASTAPAPRAGRRASDGR